MIDPEWELVDFSDNVVRRSSRGGIIANISVADLVRWVGLQSLEDPNPQHGWENLSPSYRISGLVVVAKVDKQAHTLRIVPHTNPWFTGELPQSRKLVDPIQAKGNGVCTFTRYLYLSICPWPCDTVQQHSVRLNGVFN